MGVLCRIRQAVVNALITAVVWVIAMVYINRIANSRTLDDHLLGRVAVADCAVCNFMRTCHCGQCTQEEIAYYYAEALATHGQGWDGDDGHRVRKPAPVPTGG